MTRALPIQAIAPDLRRALHGAGRIVLSAPTGSGKSTQVPRFVAEELPGTVLVLQPRRLAARMLAERVAFEMGEKPGETVGFLTRYEQVVSSRTRIRFLTEGILTRMLAGQPELPGVSAIVFDEFHERSIHTDLGLAMAKHTADTLRRDLKIIVMSATLDAAPIRKYLGEDTAVLQAEGRLYPVETTYAKQPLALAGPAKAAAVALGELVRAEPQGDVLIFMPGGYEIRKTIEECSRHAWAEQLLFLPLYGDLPPQEQHRVMEPAEKRKVIVATNIAETSLTIPGVRHVIDSGLARVNRYDPVRGVDSLQTEAIARDAAEQRAGRAGREAPGTCRRLWTWMEHSAKPSRTLPEIHRVDLAETVLTVNAFGFHELERFPWFDLPPAKMLDGARRLLESLGLLRPQNGGLTDIGRKLAAVPAHPRLAVLMHLGAENGCFAQTAWAAALLNERSLFAGTARSAQEWTERRGTARRRAVAERLPASDFSVQMELVHAAEDAGFAPDFCQRIGVNPGAARDIARSAREFLELPRKLRWDCHAADRSELRFRQCLLRAFPDRLAKRLDLGSLLCLTASGKRAELSPESTVREEPIFLAAEIRETSRGTQLSLCSGVEEEWLLDFFPDAWKETDEVLWDSQRQQVIRRQTLSCLGLLLDDRTRNDPDPEKAAEILARQLLDGKENIPNWDDAVTAWIDRVAWVSQLFPEKELPAYDEKGKEKILRELCYGESSLKKLKGKDTLCFVKNLLTQAQQQFVEKMAPGYLLLPNGRKMKLHYAPGQQPKGSAKIYDLYDLPDLPVIAAGRAKVLLDILAPNFRTVQITDDLANFWKVLYPKIKPELARRYPRHPWR